MVIRRSLLAVCSALSLLACADESGTVAPSSDTTPVAPPSDGGAGATADANVFARPQEELARIPDSIRVKGTITVKDYTSGIFQIDVTLPGDASSNPQQQPPITVARFKSPGPYEMFLPPKTKAANLSLILDFKGDGPTGDDVKAAYVKNPLKVTAGEVTGVDFTLERAAPTAGLAGAGSGVGSGSGASPAAGTGSGAPTASPVSGTGSAAPAAGATSAPKPTPTPATATTSAAPTPAAAATTKSTPPAKDAFSSVGGTSSKPADPLDPSLDTKPKK